MTYLGTRDGPLDRGCDSCRAEDVQASLTVERFGVIARRCGKHSAGLRRTARANSDGTWNILLETVPDWKARALAAEASLRGEP